jgi:glycosyltransferase involved in cell wall biosynthesis
MRHVVVMIATSFPRFPGDGVGSFMEPIAKGVAARGHDVHLVAPWHPLITRAKSEDGVAFHFFRYAPTASLNVFGYASGMRADTDLRRSAWAVAPLAVASGAWKAWRVAHKRHATVLHAHWVIPGGVIGAAAHGRRPLVVSLHGSDVFVAERHRAVGRAARAVFARADWVTACSDDLRERGLRLGAPVDRSETIPYGVDTRRFAPDADARSQVRRALEVGSGPVVFTAGRLVRKKGFEYLIDAVRELRTAWPEIQLLIAGAGDLHDELATRAAPAAPGARPIARLLGNQSQDEIARLAAAADVIAVPSVHDEAGNVDGLPNFALEALASATPVVATDAGGLPQAIDDQVTGRLVPERDARALAAAIADLLRHPERARDLGVAARAHVERRFGWAGVAERFERAYDAAAARR